MTKDRSEPMWQHLHALFCPVYFMAFFVSHNVGELAPAQLIPPFAMTLVLSAALFAASTLIFWRMSQRYLFFTLSIFAFFSYGALKQATEAIVWPLAHHPSMTDKVLIPALAFAFLAVTLWLRLKEPDTGGLEASATVMFSFLIAFNLIAVASYAVAPSGAGMGDAKDIPVFGGYRPDVYYLLFDEYAGKKTMRYLYGLDQDPFEEKLKSMGYDVLDATSRFDHTYNVLDEVLNMRDSSSNWTNQMLYANIRGNRVFATFLKNGYYVIAYSNPNEAYRYNLQPKVTDYRDFYLSQSMFSWLADEPVRIFLSSTLADPLIYYLLQNDYEAGYRRKATLDIFDDLKLEAGIDRGGPKMVYLHMLCPHQPLVLRRDGSPADPGDIRNWGDPSVYGSQHEYVSQQILDISQDIISKATRPTMVIIQSDHGVRMIQDKSWYLEKKKELLDKNITFDERLDNFYAVYSTKAYHPKSSLQKDTFKQVFDHIISNA